MTFVLQVKKEQGWQVVGTVGIEGKSLETPPVNCSDFQILKPTLLLMGKLLHAETLICLSGRIFMTSLCVKACSIVFQVFS